MSFNLSNPATKKTNEKKVPWYEKIWAGLNLIALFGDGMVPKVAKDNIPIKWRNIIILVFILILVYFLGSGIWYNTMMIIGAVKGVSFTLGDSFYYYGIIAMICVAAGYFELDAAVLKHQAINKKLIKDSIKDIGKKPSVAIANFKGRMKYIALITGLMGFINGLWIVWGIIFYDRWLFVGLLSISLLSYLSSMPLKDAKHIKMVMIAEMVITIIFIAVIMNNHFLFFSL